MLEERLLTQSVSILRLVRYQSICRKCSLDLARQSSKHPLWRPIPRIQSSQTRDYAVAINATLFSNRKIGDSFFTTSPLQEKSNGNNPRSSSSAAISSHLPQPILTRARRRKQEALQHEPNDSSQTQQQQQLPPDASSQLSAISHTHPPSSIRRILTSCLSLSKPRLSFLMVLATATSYSLYPTPSVLLSEVTTSPSLSALTLLYLTGGTFLCCASANTLNMWMEPEHDAKMSRTRNRPLVRGLISNRIALLFAAGTAILGVAGLYFGVNGTTAFLGGVNIALYAGAYTPLKRISVVNTWVGAIVGGIPPLMGWAAAAGQSATGSGSWEELLLGEENLGGWLLAGLLFAWQFPHFNALSWTIREEYKNAGYKMLCWVNPRRNGRVALRYALLLFPICWGLTFTGVTDSGYLVTSTVVNAWVLREAIKFWKFEGLKGSARSLFWAGVWQLPLLLAGAMFHKKGFWEGIWRRVFGEEEDEILIDDEIKPVGRAQTNGVVKV